MIELRDVRMSYNDGERHVDVLRGIDLDVADGERLAITGPSGCGKTTLLLLLAALETPTSGQVTVSGQNLHQLDANQLADLRRDRIGIVFQSFHLIPSLRAIDNVALPLEIARSPHAHERARDMLDAVGLSARSHHYPTQLSGGEQQRVAIARALIHEPALLLADEPTGNLDDDTGARVSDLLFDLVERGGSTFVLVTHDLSLAHRCGRVLNLHGGAVDTAPAT